MIAVETKLCNGCGQLRSVEHFTVVKKKEKGNSALNNKCYFPFMDPVEDLENETCYSKETSAIKLRLTGSGLMNFQGCLSSSTTAAAAAATFTGPSIGTAAGRGNLPKMSMPFLEKKLSEEMALHFNAVLKDLKKRFNLGRTKQLVYQVTVFNPKEEFDPG
jgi:hypothetical protein